MTVLDQRTLNGADVVCPTCDASVGWACEGRVHCDGYHLSRNREALRQWADVALLGAVEQVSA